MKNKYNKVATLTLGCAKNVTDSERIIGALKSNGFEITSNAEEADSIIVNTCGFINPAKEESLGVIYQALELKEKGRAKKVIVCGCLSERYKSELETQISGVSAFVGVNDIEAILEALKPGLKYELAGERELLTPPYTAYLKIAEGCNHQCAFCAIPKIRGKYISEPMEKLEDEARRLAARGVKELNIIAQDTTYYGQDIYGEKKLGALLSKLEAVEGLEWIRVLYAYPTGFPFDILDLMARPGKICKYADIPLQHISDNILKKMKRGTSGDKIKELIDKIREKVPGVAIRSAFIAGFPGETESDFRQLYDFLEQYRLDRVGVFTYSHEDDTPAYNLKDDIPMEVKEERRGMLMELQQKISLEHNKAKIGAKVKTLIESLEEGAYIGRTQWDAPDVDNFVIVEPEENIEIGEFYDVKINGASEYDLFGEFV